MVKIIVGSNCTGCETCVNSCPVSVYEIRDGKSVAVRVEECILCRTCESNCPEGAIQVIEAEIKPEKAMPPKVEAKKRKQKSLYPIQINLRKKLPINRIFEDPKLPMRF
jgi:NAD-dependent dihydropyrimidine dehydrogenase PreA subunit